MKLKRKFISNKWNFAIYFDFDDIFIDEDECGSVPTPCDQICSNTEGSFDCGCEEGYVLNTDGTTCEGKINKVLHFDGQ